MLVASEVARNSTDRRAGRRWGIQDDELAAKLVQLRESYGLTKAQVGDALSVSHPTIYNIETARAGVSLNMLAKFAAFYEVSLDYLAGHLVERVREGG